MEITPNPTSSLHPLFWVAGISVTLLSLAGIASLTGFLPIRPAPVPERPAVVAAAPVTEPVVAPVATIAPVAPVIAPEAPEIPARKPAVASQRKLVRKKVEQDIPVNAAAMPPPFATSVPPDYVPPPPTVYAPPAPPPCLDCGAIANVREVTHEGQTSGTGAVIGGLAGGALANNIGRGNTRTLATLAGIVGGGLLGNTIEKSEHKTISYQITVRMEDGTTRLIDSATMPSWRIGDKVKLVHGTIVSQ
jgi:outer membrane lipoprotein SlyB